MKTIVCFIQYRQLLHYPKIIVFFPLIMHLEGVFEYDNLNLY